MAISKSTHAFILLFIYRYLRFVVNAISSYCFRPVPLPVTPSLLPDNVTVIVPTICGKNNKCLRDTLQSCLVSRPYQVIIVTVDSDSEIISELAKSIDPAVQVLSIPFPNKRRQVSRAIHEVKTSIIVIADDDVEWPPKLLLYILAPLESYDVGAVGTFQRVRRNENLGIFGKVWEYLGTCYIERRNFEIAATSNIDGGLSCLSGRTAAFRAHILKDNRFINGYCNERWRGKVLNTDDDNFVTRWLVSHGWKIVIQASQEAVVQTTLETNSRFLHQCLRWARSNWRSNISSTIFERHIWSEQHWCAYALHLATLTHSLITDPLLFYLFHLITALHDYSSPWQSFLILWMLLVKITKLLPHFYRYPTDLFFLPVTLIFGYLHGFIKYYALFTLSETSWGSRDIGDVGIKHK